LAKEGARCIIREENNQIFPMTFKAYIWGMLTVSLFSFLALGGVINYVDPEKAGIPGKLVFYLVLLFFLSGFFNLLLLFLRKKMLGDNAAPENIHLSFRQSFLLALLAIGILLLQGMRMLVWWDGLLMVAGVFLIELYFLSKE
jgi:hypothetical protein